MKSTCAPLLIASLCLSPIVEVSANEPAALIYVQNYEEFIAHTKQHILNVRRLGNFAYDFWVQEFTEIPRELLDSYLKIHDFAKTASLENLKKFGYKGEVSLGERLYEFYGKDVDSLNSQDQTRLRQIIDEVNEIDSRIRRAFLKSRGLVFNNGYEKPVVKDLLKIEMLADIVDRDENPISEEEFNKKMRDAREFFEDPKDKAKAITMEIYYHRLIKNEFLLGVNSCRKTHIR